MAFHWQADDGLLLVVVFGPPLTIFFDLRMILSILSFQLCNIKCTSAMTFKMHVAGKQHQNVSYILFEYFFKNKFASTIFFGNEFLLF